MATAANGDTKPDATAERPRNRSTMSALDHLPALR